MPLRYFLMMVAFAGGMTSAFFGFHEYHLAQQSSAEPEEIALKDLIARGPDGNPNIILTDFEVGEHYLSRKNSIWVPVVPEGQETAQTAAIQAFILCTGMKKDGFKLARVNQPKLRGLVDTSPENKPSALGSALFSIKYPNTDLKKCLIIVEGKEPAGWFILTLYGLGCALGLGATVGIWIAARRMDRAANQTAAAVEQAPPH